MTLRRPLVLIGGAVQELPTGDSLPGAGGSATIYETEIDFGSTPVKSKTFTITDAGVSSGMKIIPTQSGNAATGRAADENELTVLSARAFAKTGSFDLYVDCLNGLASGKFKFNYVLGA
jgi:hypothetical protein